MVLLKFIFIIFLVFYLLSKIGGFLMRTFFGKVANQARQQSNQRQYRKPADGNVIIESTPNSANQAKKDADFRGGDYVDYEEVK